MSRKGGDIVTNGSLADLLRDYESRVDWLRRDLEHVAAGGGVSPAGLAERQRFLDQLARGLELFGKDISGRVNPQGMALRYPLPDLVQCSGDEHALIELALKERSAELEKVERETDKVVSWAVGASEGRYPKALTRVFLAAMRKKMLFIGSLVHELDARTSRVDQLVAGLREKPALAKHPVIDLLKRLFRDMGNLNSETQRLEADVHAESKRTRWMKRWLHFQKLRMDTYYPSSSIPREDVITRLGTEALRRQFEGQES